jgi:hypothetical protein
MRDEKGRGEKGKRGINTAKISNTRKEEGRKGELTRRQSATMTI